MIWKYYHRQKQKRRNKCWLNGLLELLNDDHDYGCHHQYECHLQYMTAVQEFLSVYLTTGLNSYYLPNNVAIDNTV